VVLPLGILLGVSVLLHKYLGWDGFFLNLATETIGILITVWYLQSAIQDIQHDRWTPATTRVAEELQRFVYRSTFALCRCVSLNWPFTGNYGHGVMRDEPLVLSARLSDDRSRTITHIADELLPRATQSQLTQLVVALFDITLEAGELAANYSDRLGASQYKLLLEIQHAAEEACDIDDIPKNYVQIGITKIELLRFLENSGEKANLIKDHMGGYLKDVFQKFLALEQYLAPHEGPFGL